MLAGVRLTKLISDLGIADPRGRDNPPHKGSGSRGMAMEPFLHLRHRTTPIPLYHTRALLFCKLGKSYRGQALSGVDLVGSRTAHNHPHSQRHLPYSHVHHRRLDHEDLPEVRCHMLHPNHQPIPRDCQQYPLCPMRWRPMDMIRQGLTIQHNPKCWHNCSPVGYHPRAIFDRHQSVPHIPTPPQ